MALIAAARVFFSIVRRPERSCGLAEAWAATTPKRRLLLGVWSEVNEIIDVALDEKIKAPCLVDAGLPEV